MKNLYLASVVKTSTSVVEFKKSSKNWYGRNHGNNTDFKSTRFGNYYCRYSSGCHKCVLSTAKARANGP